MGRRRMWLMAMSPVRVAEERARTAEEAAKRSEQGRLDMHERAQHLKEAGDGLMDLLRQSQDNVRDANQRTGAGVQVVGRKVDSMHESLDEFLLKAAAGGFGPGPQEELREALEAVQSVNLVGQDVRTLSKQVDALRDIMLHALEGDRERRGRHRRPGDDGDAVAAGAGEQGTGPEDSGAGPDEEERWLW